MKTTLENKTIVWCAHAARLRFGEVKAGITGPDPTRSAVLADEFQHDRTNVLVPCLAREYAVVTGIGLQVMGFHLVWKSAEDLECSSALSRC